MINLKDVKNKLSKKYYNFLDVFDRSKANKLSSYYSFDYKIKLVNNKSPL